MGLAPRLVHVMQQKRMVLVLGCQRLFPNSLPRQRVAGSAADGRPPRPADQLRSGGQGGWRRGSWQGGWLAGGNAASTVTVQLSSQRGDQRVGTHLGVPGRLNGMLARVNV